jgi:parallel beta-helix repeat protein
MGAIWNNLYLPLVFALAAFTSVGCSLIDAGVTSTELTATPVVKLESGPQPTPATTTAATPVPTPDATSTPTPPPPSIYVHPIGGDDENPGSAMKPLKTLQKAVELVGHGWPIELASAGAFTSQFQPAMPSRPVVEALPCSDQNLSWEPSSNSITLTDPVACTLSEIKARIPSSAPLTLVDEANHTWFLGANLFVRDGARLVLHGSDIGGDVDELRLKSNNSPDPNSVIVIRAEWGHIDVDSTKITSWDEQAAAPDTDHEIQGRSHIQAFSFLDKDGVTARESRMDVLNSEVSYLGQHNGPGGAAMFGLGWKVLGSGAEIFDQVDVFGDVINSHLHHNFMGAYTFGAHGMHWLNNEINDNVSYGLDPHDDSDHFLVEGNILYNNGRHGIIFSKRCDSNIIRNNISYDNRLSGIMLHQDSDNNVVENNISYGNVNGIAIYDSYDNIIRNNVFLRNRQGIFLKDSSAVNTFEYNLIYENDNYGVFFRGGSSQNSILSNTIYSSSKGGVYVKNSSQNTVGPGNDIYGNGEGIYLFTDDTGERNTILGNTIHSNDNDGIRIQSANGTAVYRNEIHDNRKNGIHLSDSSNNTVCYNRVTSNAGRGILIDGGNNNTVESNTNESNGIEFE